MDNFEEIVSGLFEDMFPSIDEDPDMYGVRVVFSDQESEDVHAIVVPWVGYNPKIADKMRHRFTVDQRGVNILTAWYNISYRHDVTPNRWIPTAAQVVRLAQIPF